MDRVGIRVEPFSTYLERRRKAPINPVVVAGGFVFVSGLPPFDPDTGDITPKPLARQTHIFLCPPVWPGPFDIEVDCIAVDMTPPATASYRWIVVGVSTAANALAWSVRSTFALFYVAMLGRARVGPRPDRARLLAELARLRRLRARRRLALRSMGRARGGRARRRRCSARPSR